MKKNHVNQAVDIANVTVMHDVWINIYIYGTINMINMDRKHNQSANHLTFYVPIIVGYTVSPFCLVQLHIFYR